MIDTALFNMDEVIFNSNCTFAIWNAGSHWNCYQCVIKQNDPNVATVTIKLIKLGSVVSTSDARQWLHYGGVELLT